jgi:hypothetical protein
MSMWIQHPVTGNVVLVLAQEHIKRLLDDGGIEVPDPRQVPLEEVVTDAANNVKNNDERSNSKSTGHDRRPRKRQSAV